MPNRRKHYSRLLEGVSQFEVDFVIPRLGSDLPLGIDPFLLYKSRHNDLSELHDSIINVFATAIELVSNAKYSQAEALLHFPEVSEIGFGYSESNKHGSGVGNYLSSLIVKTLSDSPALRIRGIRHIEELQLVSVGIGRDRISDTVANLIKEWLINYTQRQSKLWNIKLYKDVPVANILDKNSLRWVDGYFDLPISPLNDEPMIFVPRRIVRALPWINYDDYFFTEFRAFLKAKRGLKPISKKASKLAAEEAKEEVVKISQQHIEKVEAYVRRKENTAAEAQPSETYLDVDDICSESDSLKGRLDGVPTGNASSTEYQNLVLETLNFLFNPELIDGVPEVRTVDGTERRDIIFTNDSDKTFWSYIRNEHSSILLMFETKNTDDISNTYLNQTGTYLGDRLGRLGIMISRQALKEPQMRKAFSIYNDSTPRKIILHLSDSDLKEMLDMKCNGQDPMRFIQQRYRNFRTSVQ